MKYNEAIANEVNEKEYTLQYLDHTGTLAFASFERVNDMLDFCESLKYIKYLTFTFKAVPYDE